MAACTQIGSTPRDGRFGCCFTSGPLHRAYRRHGVMRPRTAASTSTPSTGVNEGAEQAQHRDTTGVDVGTSADGVAAAGAGVGAGAGAGRAPADTSRRSRCVLGARPGRRLWIANPNTGAVLSTIKLAAHTSPAHVAVLAVGGGSYTALAPPASLRKKRAKSPAFERLWRVHIGGCPLILSVTDGDVLLIDAHPVRAQLRAWVTGIGKILSVSVRLASAGAVAVVCRHYMCGFVHG